MDFRNPATLQAVVKDSSGTVLTGRTVTWSSSSTAIASVNATGLVSGVAAGSATITATSEGHNGTSAITVTANPPAAVASVTVSPASTSIAVGSTQQLQAVVKDASGNVLAGRTVTWSSNSVSIASVSGSGV